MKPALSVMVRGWMSFPKGLLRQWEKAARKWEAAHGTEKIQIGKTWGKILLSGRNQANGYRITLKSK